MAAVRAWHPLRLALLCAALAVAGGAPGARAVYAEVSARAAAAVRGATRTAAAPSRDDEAAPSLPPRARALPPPVAPARVVARLYLSHCSLLL